MSHGAKCLYVALKRRKPNERNRAYISYRLAGRELKSDRRKIREWFAELAHYSFIELAVHGCLGVDGKGRAPHWRLTECGQTSRTSAEGLFEPPTNDFLKWDGTPFDPKPYRRGAGWDWEKKQNPGGDASTRVVATWPTPPVATYPPPKSQSGGDVTTIERDQSGGDVSTITRFTTTMVTSPGEIRPSRTTTSIKTPTAAASRPRRAS